MRDRDAAYLRQIEEGKRRAHVILPHDVAEELKATSAVKPRRFENVGVLFCDIAGFTAWCDRHTPEEVHRELQALVETFERLAAKHGLENHRRRLHCNGGASLAIGEPRARLRALRSGDD